MTYAVECADLWKSYVHRPRVGLKTLLVGSRTLRESRFVRQWALRGVTFNVARGQGFGIVGHNGTGKTTLLSILLGTIFADRGSVMVHGRVASLIDLGAGFHPELTGRDNIFLHGTILGMRLYEIRRQFENIVAFSELEEAIEVPLRTYSSGMMARLGFSVIVNCSADVLLIDEVLAVGDARFQEKCREFIHRFKARNGTLIIVSHDMAELAETCEEGMCLEMGNVAKQGAMEDVIAHYHATVLTETKPSTMPA